MTIPKIIHYIWFGGLKPRTVIMCIASWKSLMPDYEIVEWNENNLDLETNKFAKDAYYAKEYAFSSDYFRFEILSKYGGIYLDTDMQVLKRLDDFLDRSCFVGYENIENDKINGAIIGSIPHHPYIKACLLYYENMLGKHPLINNPMSQNADMLQANEKIEYQYFYPRFNQFKKELLIKGIKENYCIHWGDASWEYNSNFFNKYRYYGHPARKLAAWLRAKIRKIRKIIGKNSNS